MAGELDKSTPITNPTRSLPADTRPVAPVLAVLAQGLSAPAQPVLPLSLEAASQSLLKWQWGCFSEEFPVWGSKVCAGQTNLVQAGLMQHCWSGVVSMFLEEPLKTQPTHPNLLPGILFCSVPDRSLPSLL